LALKVKEKIEAINREKILFNRTLADAVAQPGPLPQRPARPIPAHDGYTLDASQRKAYQTALRSLFKNRVSVSDMAQSIGYRGHLAL